MRFGDTANIYTNDAGAAAADFSRRIQRNRINPNSSGSTQLTWSTPLYAMFPQDPEFNLAGRVTPRRALHTEQISRAFGESFAASLSTYYWTGTTAGGASFDSTNHSLTMTATTGNSSVRVHADKVAPRFLQGHTNILFGGVQVMDTGITGNTRRWGAVSPSGNDGLFWQLQGTTFGIVRRIGGNDSFTPVASWSIDRTFTLSSARSFGYEIMWLGGVAFFSVAGKPVHQVNADPFLNDLDLTLFYENTSTAAASTAVLRVLGQSISNFGRTQSRAQYRHVATTGAVQVKNATGTLQRIVINSTANSTMTIRDATDTNSTRVIAVANMSNPGDLSYDCDFAFGLNIDIQGLAADVTVLFD